MTEGDKAFYKRRIREELKKANAVENRRLRQLHLRWALLYQERLDGVPKGVARAQEARLPSAEFDFQALVTSSERDC